MSQLYGFQLELQGVGSQLFGFQLEVDYNLTVNVVDGDTNPLTNQTIQLYDENQNLLDSVFTTTGTWYFSLFEAGTYYISAESSDRLQEITFDGATPLEEEFIVKGIKLEYRVKTTSPFGDSDWSDILEKNI